MKTNRSRESFRIVAKKSSVSDRQRQKWNKILGRNYSVLSLCFALLLVAEPLAAQESSDEASSLLETQNITEQNITEQNITEQNITEQNITEQIYMPFAIQGASSPELIARQEDEEAAEAAVSAAAAGKPSVAGKWSRKIDLPVNPVGAANLPNGKLLIWSTGRNTIFDPATGEAKPAQTSPFDHNMFCPGTTNLADGSVLINGGKTDEKTSIYKVGKGWTNGGNMNIPRGYNANVMLSNGSVMTIGGSWADGKKNATKTKHAEVWKKGQGWSRLRGIPVTPILEGTGSETGGVYRSDNHAWLWTAANGKVFHAGPSSQMHWFDASGSGSYKSAGKRGNDGYSMTGNTVMFDTGKLLKTGGAESYAYSRTDKDTSNDEIVVANKRAYVININTDSAAVSQVNDMKYSRAYHNSVVLPTGEVMVVGGKRTAEIFSDDNARMTPEIWNPNTEKWRSVANMAVARTYHSTAILLPDGRVFVGGGGLCGDCGVNHPDAQLYSPPYLFKNDGSKAVRPRIQAAPNSASNGDKITVKTNSKIKSFALIRLSSVTHGTNNDQRRLKLDFSSSGGNSYKLSLSPSKGNLPPGYYMLFAIKKSGTPSVAHILQIQ